MGKFRKQVDNKGGCVEEQTKMVLFFSYYCLGAKGINNDIVYYKDKYDIRFNHGNILRDC